ncbi:hypothetical protein JOL79_20350 [Microbispora sp. RL4-1S]|uniref:Uncharacterized protein n=1 Tax=Microbispora oryzae TaxID=2806554 RepID=A0A941AJC2_9ACTN|nr:hypothetical protein [Microbispora oryzae]MBP2706165.1 hypothetical protein [Microbispora oryzae]
MAFTVPGAAAAAAGPPLAGPDVEIAPLSPPSIDPASRAGRDPPCGYRARAVLTRTLEICRR